MVGYKMGGGWGLTEAATVKASPKICMHAQM